ncbi:DUF565 domain-containing protein [Cyanobacterium aponinum UTEX 3222]|uniref:DUF565 domain-containing protein n=2 Tax=Cyanobacterium aponinum TaxID=379064 RepID=K9YZS2_CYAAP|nr:DUF565 domain-containing protein [Cyanobacterium aponinum]WRL40379.1 DUF565 domain-containing protein [Cyanobacterium aponinum UTEX 3222]AFZ52451.1 protein of unknown function DUF565 [Cyanobacterium aponinum PCC 10605]MBD2394477.1 DUF565 domain-containing protein [Cyanobacterium aponinum FACHB-4101]PHV63650.1 DUF565 domain-containing protein [Cyanobacterium aponinum IPPAS B-1201]WPF87455.1 DUF565 domain-containing protein [Cyanobacterium aponinum AL20115]
MQETRLNLLIGNFTNQIKSFLNNPWRKLSFVIIGFLSGYITSDLLSTSLAQAGKWDVPMATTYLIFTEITSMIVYGGSKNRNKIMWADLLNSFKIGLAFGLYLSAMTLAS